MKITSETQEEIEIVEKGLLDSGATGKFIDQNYTKEKGLELKTLEKPLQVYNVDGTLNKRGTIKYYVDLIIEVHGKKRKERLMVTGIGKTKIILGFTWLQETNPKINWKKGTLKWRKTATNETPQEHAHRTPASISEEDDEDEHLNSTRNPLDESDLSLLISTITGTTDNDEWINAKLNKSTEIQAEINLKKKELPLEEQILKEFHEYLDVFSEEKAARFPETKAWDHKIEMKDTFVPKSFKTYNLTPEETTELEKFLKDNL